jgi:hypothetical protein
MAASSSKMLQVARKTGRKADQRKTKRKKSNSRNSYRPLTSDYHDLSTNVMVVNTFLLEIDVNHIVCKNMYIYRIYIYIHIYIYVYSPGALPQAPSLKWKVLGLFCGAHATRLGIGLGFGDFQQLKPKFSSFDLDVGRNVHYFTCLFLA